MRYVHLAEGKPKNYNTHLAYHASPTKTHGSKMKTPLAPTKKQFKHKINS